MPIGVDVIDIGNLIDFDPVCSTYNGASNIIGGHSLDNGSSAFFISFPIGIEGNVFNVTAAIPPSCSGREEFGF